MAVATASTGIDCISRGYKDLLSTLISKNMAQNILIEVLGGMPICEPMPSTLSPEGQAKVEAARQKSPEWNVKVDYTDAAGVTTPANSPSDLARRLGLKISGLQTLCDGEKCKAVDVVDIFRLQGFMVECEVEKDGKIETTLDCVKAAGGGKAMHVYHPGVFELKNGKKITAK